MTEKAMDMEKGKEDALALFYVETRGRAYIQYDYERHTATLTGGGSVTLPEDRMEEFVHLARLLGLDAGRVKTTLP